ncbi:MAG TPA: S8 family serine peptidase [Bryobacteraceae bacterium]|nr:S8 family serine peptidase [Bryobacteraceae bacterium]
MMVPSLFRNWWLVGLLLATGATAQIVPGEYIVELAGEPAATSLKTPRSASARTSVRAMQARVQTAMAATGAEVYASVDTVLNALMVRTADAATLNAIPGVARVYPVRLYKLVMDRAGGLHKLPAAGAIIGGAANAGAGMKIGIIDTGVDSSHPAFADAGFQMPDGFPRVNRSTDTRYTNNKVIVARNYDRDVSTAARDLKGHGTSVAAVAAGVLNTGPSATFAGIAPRAYIGSYKVFPDDREGAPDSAILEALNDAVNDGMDVVNLSLGSFPAGRLDDDPLVRAVENAVQAGVIVVVSAGNEGPGIATIGSPATAPSAIAVGASVNDRVFASTVWMNGLDPLVGQPADGSGSAAPVRAAMVDVTTLDPTGLLCQPIASGSLTGSIVLIRRGECFFEDKLNFARDAGAIAAIVATDADRPDTSVMSVGAARLPAMMIGYEDGVRAREQLQGGPIETQLDFAKRAVLVNSAALAEFTSKGPSVDLRLKPDVLAVGTAVYTARPATAGSPSYGTVQGTSFSAPIVAGAAALLKAFKPGLSPEHYKSLLVNTAATFLARDGSSFPMQHTGAGLLDLQAAVRSTLAVAPASLGFGSGGSTSNLTQRLTLKNVSSTGDTFAITAEPRQDAPAPRITPDVVDLPAGGSAEVVVQWTASGLAPRAYEGFLIARGTQGDAVTRIPYWYASTARTPSTISVVEAPESANRSSRQEFYVRALDVAGVPVLVEPRVTVVSEGAGARVGSIESMDSEYPGFYRVVVYLSSEAGANVFEIESGSAKVRVTINGV